MKPGKKTLSQQKFLEKRLMFKYLLHLSVTSGVFALINETDKRILIKSAKNVVKTLFSIISNIPWWYGKDLYRDRHKLRVMLLAECPASRLDGHKLAFIEQYKAQGYTLYNKERLPAYKVKKRVTEEAKVDIVLVSAGKRVYTVATVDTNAEADRFISDTSLADMMKLMEKE
jgi:hypothetical protein